MTHTTGHWESGGLVRKPTTGTDLSFGQYVLYRMRFVLAGELAHAWSDLGALVGQLGQLSIVIEMSITDRAGIAITYGHRARMEIGKIAPKRSPDAEYLDFLSNINADIRSGVIRDFEAKSEASKNERERERITKEKGRSRPGRARRGRPRRGPRGRGGSGPKRIGRPGAQKRIPTARAQSRMRRRYRRQRTRRRRMGRRKRVNRSNSLSFLPRGAAPPLFLRIPPPHGRDTPI